MVVFEDTRNQPGKHENIHKHFDRFGIQWVRTKLYVGDYQISDNASFVVDTKSGVLELMSDIYQQHDRFRRECERAQDAGIRLLILTEEKLPSEGLVAWKSPRKRNGQLMTKGDPVKLRKAMITMQAKYNVRFRFCSREKTGETLMRYLLAERQVQQIGLKR